MQDESYVLLTIVSKSMILKNEKMKRSFRYNLMDNF